MKNPCARLREAFSDPVRMARQKTVDVALRQAQGRVDHDVTGLAHSQGEGAATIAATQQIRRVFETAGEGAGFFGTGGGAAK